MSIELTEEDMRLAIDRIARTPDGSALYHYLQKVLCGVTTDSVPECALPRNEGRRSLASELMGLMAEGMRASGGREQSVIFARREPAGIKRKLTAREYFERELAAGLASNGSDTTGNVPVADAE